MDYSFIGRNVQAVRRRCGMTQTELARRIGTHQGPLSLIESGENIPSSRLLYQISRVLDVPADVFFVEDQMAFHAVIREDSQILFRVDLDDSRLTEKTEASLIRIMDAVLSLEDMCGAPKGALIPLCLKMEMTYEGIDKLVRRVRDIMDIRDGVIFDYFELYEIHGFRVIALPLFRRIHSALYFDSKNENAFFFVNVRNNPERQLFCLLYELGHLLIYMWYRKNEKIKSSSSSLSALTIQKAAKKFAALFLMPAPAVYSTVDQLGIKKKQWDFELLLRIKHRFGVSAEAFLYRLEELDLIDKSQVDDLRSRIHAYYKETDFGEPASSRRILNYNGRVWDLVLTAKADTKNADEVQKIETLFSKHRVVKI